ncbi:MAG: ATP-binding protein, partial [Clostridia bacterium]|nr:ATP-binding protein [Clostridia bacterium]
KNAILKKSKIKKIDYDCAICQDTGYINGKICSCVKELAKNIITNDLCSVMPINECTFDNFELKYYSDADSEKRMRSILKLCREYAESFNPETSSNLLFMGASGLGKTHLSLAIAGEVIKKGYLPVYGPAENLFNEIEKERFSSYGKESDSYNTMINCDLLVIDDLGSEFMTTFSKSILYNLINSRILSRKPTIISTNLSMKELEKLYSARITSRLIGSYDARLFLGKDIRQQKSMKG